MPGGRTKFQEKWLESKDSNGDIIGNWCKKGQNEWEAYCLLCKCPLLVSNGGISQLLQHASRVKHHLASKQLKNQKPLEFFKSGAEGIDTSSSAKPVLAGSLNTNDLGTRAEALWTMKVAISNFSFGSCTDVVALFKEMFCNHPVTNNMHLSDRKVSYVLAYGLGPYFHNELVLDLQSALTLGNCFTLAFDETTTAQVKKQLDIIVKYWSPKFNCIITGYLTSLFFGHASAEDISCAILKALEADNLPLKKLLMLSMDGPNINLAVMKKLNKELANSGSPELVDIGTCTLHKVHNCFSKALSSLPLDVDELATDMFSFFKVSAARREDLKKIEKLLECEEKFLLRHVNSRWLSLGPVVTRILSVYPALVEYFLQFLPKQKDSWGTLQNNGRYKRIASALKDPMTVVYLEFISSFSPSFQSYLRVFQTEGPLIHMLYSKMNCLLRAVMLKFMKEEVVANLEGGKLLEIDIDDHLNYRPLKDVNIGEGTRRALLKIKETDVKGARMTIRSFLVKVTRFLKGALPLSNCLLRDMEKLHPIMRAQRNENAVRHLCMHLKTLKMDSQTIDRVLLEWQAYKLDPEVDKICAKFGKQGNEDGRIDEFWRSVFCLRDKHSGNPKYANIATLVKNCLSLSHGNSDVERGFSDNRKIVSDTRTNLSEATIIGVRHVKDAVKRYGHISAIPITRKLLNSVAKSHSAYMDAKEKEKKAAEEHRKKRTLEEEEQKAADEAKRQKKETCEKIKKVGSEINDLQDDLMSAQKCLTEGNTRLQTALKNKKFNDMRIASTIIDAATSKVQELTEQLNKAQEKKFKLQSSLKH